MIRAIIIDDEPAVAQIITYFIKKEGLPIEIVGTANNGIDGLSLIRQMQPNVVFLDIQMPLMNGFIVMQNETDTRYIIITAFESFEYAQQALREGAADILLKPIDIEQLKLAVERAVGWHITKNDTINSILEYMHSHYAENLSLQNIADHFYLSPNHVARLFKYYVGNSVMSYLHLLRINHAKKMLKEGMSIKDTSAKVGYENLNVFYRHFKMIVGMTPAEYVNN